MTAKYFNFVDGQRLPGDRVKEFLMNQAVIQCANQTEITSSGIEVFGARVALNMEDGQIWTYGGEPAAWAPAQNALDLELLDARYLTRLAADGLYLTEIQADGKYLTDAQAAQKYLTILTAQGLYITEGQADGKYLTPAQANALYLTPLDADSRYITLVAAGQIYLRKDDADTDFQKKPTTGTFITDIQAGQIYLSQTNAASEYVTKINAGNLYIAKTENAGTYVTTISGDKITTGSINADLITSGTLVGRVVRTASGTGKRVILSNSNNWIAFYQSGDSDGSPTGVVQGTANGLSVDARNGTQVSFETSGNQIAFVSGSGMGFNGSDKRWIGALRSTGNLSSDGAVIANLDGTPATLHSNGGISAGSGQSPEAGEILASGNIQSGVSLVSGTTVVVGVMNTTSLAANVRHASNGSALIRFTSDARIKDDIQPLDEGLSIINQLSPVTFDSLVDDDERRIPGFIAQDVEQVFPEDIYMVTQVPGLAPEGLEIPDIEENPLRSLEPTHFIPYLVKAVQELSAKNEELEARLAALEGGAP